jgi:hypothetical protein
MAVFQCSDFDTEIFSEFGVNEDIKARDCQGNAGDEGDCIVSYIRHYLSRTV